LIQHGALSLDPINLRLERKAKGLPEKVHPLEKSVYEAVDAEAGSLLSTVRRNTATAADRLRGRLDQLGLLIPANRVGLVHFAPVAVVGIVALFGIAKIFVGISRHRPVGYLFMLVISTCALGFLLYWLPCFRSRRGDATIEKLKRNNKALEYTAGRRGYALTDDDLVMAIGLFGVGVLAGGPLAHLATPFRAVVPSRVTSGSTSCSSWWTSCSSSSCSGGGGGGCGGGCGGGGCGGCGG
jgi:uncharacterized protein (TIGR04222 family)